jgi:hypothetical protein
VAGDVFDPDPVIAGCDRLAAKVARIEAEPAVGAEADGSIAAANWSTRSR